MTIALTTTPATTRWYVPYIPGGHFPSVICELPMDPLLFAGNIIRTADSAAVVIVIFTARYMSDIGITNLCMYIRSGPVAARWSIYTFG